MATLDQLPPDSRAIIELVLGRGQSYAELSETLGMPEARVREHARDALAALAPRSAERVDPQWRGQVADYVLGQQTGPEAKATRSHLRSSESARTWAVSVLDSVGHLYPNGAEPHVPSGGRRDGERAEEPGAGAGAPPTAEAERSAQARAPAATGTGAQRPERSPARGGSRRSGGLSPEARAVVRRRRIVGGIAALVAAAALVVVATQVLGGDDDDPASGDAQTAAQGEQELLLQAQLQPVGNTRGSGAAVVFRQAEETAVLARARLPAPERGETYGAWLFNDRDDAIAIPTQTDPRGNVQAFGPVADPEQHRFLDISVQDRGQNRRHSGNSVLRGPLLPAETPEAPGAAPEGDALPEGGLPPAPEGG